jgi:hypothetical protein
MYYHLITTENMKYFQASSMVGTFPLTGNIPAKT